jgi:hypothetical protein
MSHPCALASLTICPCSARKIPWAFRGQKEIHFFDIATHRITRVFDLENGPAWGAPGLAISPDKKTILYTQLDALHSDIILVENFR